jgi:perosamine synthetase
VNTLIQWPVLTERDYDAVNRVLRSGRLVGGSEARAFANEWATYLGVERCLSVSSCTHALHLALYALGIRAGDEVIVPALTFCGSAAPIVLCGATPIFADVHPRTFNLDPIDVARRVTSKTRAIVPVHLHGLPCDIEAIATAAPCIPIVEDACQAHGATVFGKKVGGLGTIGCFSLNQVKPLGGGQGGMVVSNDGRLMDLACLLATHGGGEHVGFSYGITELAAALARSQLLSLDTNNLRARSNAHHLSRALVGFEDLTPQEGAGYESAWHKYRLLLPDAIDPDVFVNLLAERGVPADRWPGSLVPHRSEYRRFGAQRVPVSEHVYAHSVIIGSEQFPLAAQHPETMEDWAKHIRDLL